MMRALLTLVLGLLVALASSVAVVPDARAQADVHVVQSGDTLFNIAQRYGTTVPELRALNNLTGDTIRIGQRLVVRRTGAVPPREREPVETVVDSHPDVEFDDEEEEADIGPSPPGVRPPDLVAPDPIPTGPPPPPPPPADIERITIGREAAQPLPTEPVSEAGGAGIHVVRSGETLFSLARRYGTSVDTIRRANDLRGDIISVGQQLVVPGAAAPAVARIVRPGRYDVRRSTLPDDEVHVVLRGETLFSIADRYGTTAGRLLALNTVSTAPLAPGMILALPDGVGREHHREPAPPRIDEEGLALIYPASYVGRMTISEEPYDPAALTASHRHLPFGTLLRVIATESGRQTLVRVNDRGPVSEGFLIELSDAAARALGLRPGSAHEVQLQVLR